MELCLSLPIAMLFAAFPRVSSKELELAIKDGFGASDRNHECHECLTRAASRLSASAPGRERPASAGGGERGVQWCLNG